MININEVYQIDAIELLNTIKDDSINALIMDLPYLSGNMTLTGRKLAREKKYTSNKGIYIPLLVTIEINDLRGNG